MDLTQSIIVFLASLLLAISFFCLISCYYRWKQLKQQKNDVIEEAELLQRRQQTPDEVEEREI